VAVATGALAEAELLSVGEGRDVSTGMEGLMSELSHDDPLQGGGTELELSHEDPLQGGGTELELELSHEDPLQGGGT